MKKWIGFYLVAQVLDIVSTFYGQSRGLLENNPLYHTNAELIAAKCLVSIGVLVMILGWSIPRRIKVVAVAAPSCALILAAGMNTLLASNLI